MIKAHEAITSLNRIKFDVISPYNRLKMAYDLPLIWQASDWPRLHVDLEQLQEAYSRARRSQGLVEGRLALIGFEQRRTLEAEAWSQDALATAAIEGERYDLASVRSSIERRLGFGEANGHEAPRNVEGLLDIMDDAVRRAGQPLTHERLHAWQAALFPTGYSGMRKILVGAYRTHVEPMQIVSGGPGHEKVHYEAPPSDRLPVEMEAFVTWFNSTAGKDPLITAAIAHLWFEIVHPFEDGNGRVGRVVIDLVLAREMGFSSRLIRMSQQLLDKRKAYYAELEAAQHASVDVTRWVQWFLEQVRVACEDAVTVIDATLSKARFWVEHESLDITPRQRKVLNVLLDAGPHGFEGGMSTRKYASIASTSTATASRELQDLVARGCLRQLGAGRSTRYYVAIDGWVPRADGDGERASA